MTFTATLTNAQQAITLIDDLRPRIKARLQAGRKLYLSITEETKTREQEEKYHAQIGDIYKAMKSAGSEWSREDWKRLLIDQWAQDNGQEGSRVAPSLDGKRIVQLGLQSRRFNLAQGSSFIEWLYAWGTERGVTFYDES
jgi:hypothetical protein